MLERVSEDIKGAMKAKEKDKLDALRMLKSKLLENKTSAKPIAEADVAISYCKKLRESIELYPDGSEQKAKLEHEIEILAPYVPKQLGADDVRAIINDIIKDQGPMNFGAMMKELTPKIKGQFDGKAAADLVKSVLAS